MRGIALAITLLVGGCTDPDSIPNHDALIRQVEGNQIGSDRDQWIEMLNMAGEWERTGLIFGYNGDQGECLKAIAGLQKANPARQYRCMAAN